MWPPDSRVSTSNSRRDGSSVCTNRAGTSAAGSTRTDAPAVDASTIATKSTRSASATNVFTGSALGRHSPSAPASATVPVTSPSTNAARQLVVERDEQRRELGDGREERPGRRGRAVRLEEQAEVGEWTFAERSEVAELGVSASAADGSAMSTRTSDAGHSLAKTAVACSAGAAAPRSA